ncbi:MAG: hypothetical protein V4558_03860 [Gemmatimonadota bacterium]
MSERTMISFRRLRAVFVFSAISALVWVIGSVLISIVFALKAGRSLSAISLVTAAIVFAFCGFVAGAVYSVGIAMAPRKDSQDGLSVLRSVIFGAVGGGFVFLAISLGLGEINTTRLLTPLLVFSAIGGVTGIAIQRVARRGALPEGAPEPRLIPQGDPEPPM